MVQPPIHVLLVDDDEDDVVLTRQILGEIKSSTFAVDWVPDFDAAMQQTCSGKYDVCLVDFRLGLHDGVEFIKQAVARMCRVPIILLTGQGDHSIDMAAMNAGAADFLNKSQLTAAILERSIRYSIQQRRAEEHRIGLLREQAARAEAEAANRSKDQFLAVLSHELRTPLTAVLLNLVALETEAGVSPKLREIVQVIRRNVDLEARLIDDLLDLTRVTRGKLELRRERVNLHEQLDHAIKTCCGDDLARKKLQLESRTGAEQPHLLGDPARIQQVLWNLVKNAIKFTPPGGKIEIETANDKERLRLSIADTGIGIPPEALPKIFRAFEQADRSITRQFGGLGLGLAVCKAIVELHGGRIWAHSEGLGRGATFTAEFPVAKPDPNPTAGQGPANATAAPAQPGLSVLLVEDHPDTAQAMSRLLTRRGYQVRVANRMADALDLAAENHFDLLISDIGLPDGTGLELMTQLRRTKPIKGIALSGFGMDEDIERSRAVGFTEHLTKPIDFRQLEQAIARMTGDPQDRSTAGPGKNGKEGAPVDVRT